MSFPSAFSSPASDSEAHPSQRFWLRFCSLPWLFKGASITAVVNTVIAVILWWLGLGTLDQQLVYSQAIGLSIWALTNAGAVLLSRPTDPGGFPKGWRLLILVPGCTVLGILLGVMVGDVYAGRPMWALGPNHSRLSIGLFLMSLSVGLVMTLYFYLDGKSRYLQAELERSQRQQAEAQLRLLQSQLEPHMLFNTLANLRVLITLDAPRAQVMLDHLIAFLRATLQASRASQHPLALEFERLQDYLALMSVRMGQRLQHTLHLPPDLRRVAVPPLLLQPLVENAIRHGLEPHVDGGQLVVSAHSIDSPSGQRELVLDVTDTGVGCIPTEIKDGFGLSQVRDRLHTCYGDAARLEIHPLTPQGTHMRVRMPCVGSNP